MKKILALVLALTMVLAFASCAKTETTVEDDTTTTTVEDVTTPEFPYLTINTEAFTVTAKDGYDTAGVTAYICDVTATYSFASDNDEVTWDVYVLDAPFEDEVRYLNQAETAVLSGNGNVEIEAGKYIYLACSNNAFSADEAADATLSINMVEE